MTIFSPGGPPSGGDRRGVHVPAGRGAPRGGVRITGSDAHESGAVEHLRALGVPVTIGHLPESVEGADCVIRTAAVHDDNPEIAAARPAGHPRLRAGPGVGSHHAALPQRPVCGGDPRKDHHHLYVHPHVSATGLDPTVIDGAPCRHRCPATGWARGRPSSWSPVSTATPSSPSSPPWR